MYVYSWKSNRMLSEMLISVSNHMDVSAKNAWQQENRIQSEAECNVKIHGFRAPEPRTKTATI